MNDGDIVRIKVDLHDEGVTAGDTGRVVHAEEPMLIVDFGVGDGPLYVHPNEVEPG